VVPAPRSVRADRRDRTSSPPPVGTGFEVSHRCRRPRIAPAG